MKIGINDVLFFFRLLLLMIGWEWEWVEFFKVIDRVVKRYSLVLNGVVVYCQFDGLNVLIEVDVVDVLSDGVSFVEGMNCFGILVINKD